MVLTRRPEKHVLEKSISSLVTHHLSLLRQVTNGKGQAMNVERRKRPRVAFRTEAKLTGTSVNGHGTRISDLSAGGAFIDTIIHLEKGDVIDLEFSLGETLIQVRCEIIYHIEYSGIGVRFLNLDPDHEALIASLTELVMSSTIQKVIW